MKYALTTKWVSYAGGDIDPDAVYAMGTDSHTNAYFGGVLGKGWLDNQDAVDTIGLLDPSGVFGSGYVAKAGNDGVLAWVSTLSYVWGSAIYGVTSTSNAVYVGGSLNNEVYDYDLLESYPWVDALVSSVNTADGTLNWSHELSSVSGGNFYFTESAYTSVAVDTNGNIYAVGYTTITNLPSSTPYADRRDVVIAKYEPINGDLVWIRYLGGVNDEEAHAVSVGVDGLYVSGYTKSPGSWITLGNNTLPSSSKRYGFLAKLDFNGAVKYTTILGGSGDDKILAMQSVSNAIYVAGTTTSTNFCTAAHQLNKAGGNQDGFVLKLTDYGTTYQTNWFRYVGTNTTDAVYALSLMDSNRVVVCGSTGVGGWLPEFDEFSKAYAGGTDGFIYQLNRDTGAPVWSTYVGTASNDTAQAIASCGNTVFLGGITSSAGWEMFGGFQDQWGTPENGHLNTETGFVGKWSSDAGVPPVITNDLTDVTVHEGERVEFFLGVSSTLEEKYYWFKNGMSVGGASTNRYVIASASPADNSTFYQCIASNVLGCATSSVAHLTVIANGALDVSLTPPSAVAAGAAWQLTGGVWRTSGAVALSPGTYTVAFTNIPGWTTPETREVVITSSTTTTVVVAYIAPVATSVRTIGTWTNVSLAVTCPPEVTTWSLVETLPVNSTPVNYGAGVWNGTARTLTYTGSGNSVVSYTVLLGAVGDYDVSGTLTSMPLNVSMPVTGDQVVSRGDFLRKISGTNVWIYMSQPVPSKLWILTEDFSQTLLTPDNFSMSEYAMWDAESKTLTWMRTSSGAGEVLSYTVSGAQGSSNILSGACYILGELTTRRVYGDDTVIITQPQITNDLTDVIAHEGERVEFLFGVNTVLETAYYWFRNGVPVGGISTNRYVISAAVPPDNNTVYQCIASNVLGCTTSRVAHLTVIANGVLDVSITPPAAVARGATWQLTGGVWRASGAISLYPGTYTVAFTNLPGWITPSPREIVVESSKTTTVVAVYVAPVATAVRTISNWTNVSLAVTTPPEVTTWTLVEQLPTNSVPTAYGTGAWNGTTRTLTYTGSGASSLSYTVLLGAFGDYEVSGNITSMPINVSMPVTGAHVLSRGDFLRKINGTQVTVYMSQPIESTFWALTEDLFGTTLSPSNISLPGPGTWNAGNKKITWTSFSSGAGVVLSYSVSGTEGSTNMLSGSCYILGDSVTRVIYGDNTVIIPAPALVVPPPTIVNFVWNGTSAFLTFTSVVQQAYMVLTNANLSVTNGWKNCVPATGQGATTTVVVPVVEPQLFYRVKSE